MPKARTLHPGLGKRLRRAMLRAMNKTFDFNPLNMPKYLPPTADSAAELSALDTAACLSKIDAARAKRDRRAAKRLAVK